MTNPDPTGAIPADDPANVEPTAEIFDAELVPPTGAPGIAVPDPDYTPAGVPTFDFIRDKIENRITTAVGSQELAEATPEGRQVEEMMRERDAAAKQRLEEIRRSMGS